ncbi:MAG: hypothetical protein KAR45_07475 [Desulfobacteraceae bacterium]|nr:hypothetical protein [Desulfobacteraceae bacterium]
MKIDKLNSAYPGMQYKHIFGPVPSRRLGFSLGVEKQVIDKYINDLEQEKKIIGKTRERGVFYQTLKEQ